MHQNQRMFVAVLSLASLGLGSLPFLAGIATPTAPFGEAAQARMAAHPDGSLFLGNRPDESL